MKDDTNDRQIWLPEREAQLWGFFVEIGVLGAEELRKEIGLNELDFRHLATNLNGEPKRYFFYRVLDEIQKAALKIADWKESLSEGGLEKWQRIDFETQPSHRI
jgi:hypothetical protein